MTLKELLAEWTEWDVAQYYLACCLGLMTFDNAFENFRKSKGVFWARNEVGSMLHNTLRAMAANSILEFDEEEDTYRWNKAFRRSWESGQ